MLGHNHECEKCSRWKKWGVLGAVLIGLHLLFHAVEFLIVPFLVGLLFS